jgi:outer membrane protein assembly factor BamB
MNRYTYKGLIIEIVDEPDFKLGSKDNNFIYDKYYYAEDAGKYRGSQHGVRLYKDGVIVKSCLIIATGGATTIHQRSSILDEDKLVVCCGDSVFCFSIPALDLVWNVKADQATCFNIVKNEDNYIIHGELQISKINKEGQILWEFSGSDIFVSLKGNEEFIIENDGILLEDFEGTKYKIDFDGKLIWDTYNRA